MYFRVYICHRFSGLEASAPLPAPYPLGEVGAKRKLTSSWIFNLLMLFQRRILLGKKRKMEINSWSGIPDWKWAKAQWKGASDKGASAWDQHFKISICSNKIMYLSYILSSISLIYQPYFFQIAVVFLSFSQRYFFLTLIGPRLNWRMSVTRYPHPIIRLSNSFSFIIFIFQLFLEIVLTIHCKLWILLGCLYTSMFGVNNWAMPQGLNWRIDCNDCKWHLCSPQPSR